MASSPDSSISHSTSSSAMSPGTDLPLKYTNISAALGWSLDSSISYNNIGPGPELLAETQSRSQHFLTSAKVFFPGACYTCGSLPSWTGFPIKICAGCQLVSYCDKLCQRVDWKVHKIICKKCPVEMGKNVIVRKTESVRKDYDKFILAIKDLQLKILQKEGESLNKYRIGVTNIFLNPRVCKVCREARKEMLFDCRCCYVSYCSESHRLMDTKHWSNECDLLYSAAMACWYLSHKRQLQIPDGLLNEVNLDYGLKFEKVSNLSKYSNDKWLETIVNLINERLIFPLTIHHALKNLKLSEQRKSLTEITSLTIHIVHEEPMLDPRMWEFMLHQLSNLKVLNLTFINWKMNLNTSYNSFLLVERCSDCKKKERVINYSLQPMHYHEYFSSDDYDQPDAVAVFGTSFELISGIMQKGENKAERFTSLGNMTYSKNTIVILTDVDGDLLKESSKRFYDARPVKVLLPIQKNPAVIFNTARHDAEIDYCLNRYFCCIQRNH